MMIRVKVAQFNADLTSTSQKTKVNYHLASFKGGERSALRVLHSLHSAAFHNK